MPDYPESGALFHNQKANSDKSPTMTGYVELTPSFLRQLLAEAESNGTVKMQIASWTKQSKNGREFFSLKASMPMSPQQRQQTVRRGAEIPDDEIPF